MVMSDLRNSITSDRVTLKPSVVSLRRIIHCKELAFFIVAFDTISCFLFFFVLFLFFLKNVICLFVSFTSLSGTVTERKKNKKKNKNKPKTTKKKQENRKQKETKLSYGWFIHWRHLTATAKEDDFVVWFRVQTSRHTRCEM